MNITILGAGALGSIIAALLQQSGEDVTLIARGNRARLLAEKGVRVTGLVDITAPVRIVEDTATLSEPDALLVCVKTYDMDSGLAGVKHLRPGVTLGLQNGVLKNDQLAAVFGSDAVLGCMADFSGEVSTDGTALFTRNENIYAGELPAGVSPRVEALVAALQKAGIKAEASAQIQTVEWSKFVAWVGLTAVSVLSRLPTHRFAQDPDLARLLVTITGEAASIAGRLGVPLEDLGGLLLARTLSTASLEDGIAAVQGVGRTMASNGVTAHKMSALQDAERGRRLEVEETLGDAVRRAGELGLEVPALDACYRLLAAMNRSV